MLARERHPRASVSEWCAVRVIHLTVNYECITLDRESAFRTRQLHDRLSIQLSAGIITAKLIF